MSIQKQTNRASIFTINDDLQHLKSLITIKQFFCRILTYAPFEHKMEHNGRVNKMACMFAYMNKILYHSSWSIYLIMCGLNSSGFWCSWAIFHTESLYFAVRNHFQFTYITFDIGILQINRFLTDLRYDFMKVMMRGEKVKEHVLFMQTRFWGDRVSSAWRVCIIWDWKKPPKCLSFNF